MQVKEREEEGKKVERNTCSSLDCDYIHYNNPIPVVGAIIEVNY